MIKTKVVIIIPIYNVAEYLSRCLDSIFSQNYKNFDVVCINDGSTDNSLEILKKYENIMILNQDNNGVSAARNAGLDYCEQNYKNEPHYISFIDADDFIDSDYISTLVNFIEKNEVDIACCSFKYEHLKKSKPFKQIDVDQKVSSFLGTKLLVEDKTIQSHSHCKLYKSNLWKDVRFPVGIPWMEDQATIFKVFHNAKNGIFISNYCGYHYWQEGSSACRSNVTNERILASLYGYKIPCDFEYSNFSNNEQVIVRKSACDALASLYLMVFAYLDKKHLTSLQKEKFNEYRKYLKKNKIVKTYKPTLKKEKMKRMAYLYCSPFYRILYKLFS